MRTCIKAWMSLNVGQIPPLTTELAALEHLKKQCHHFLACSKPVFMSFSDTESVFLDVYRKMTEGADV